MSADIFDTLENDTNNAQALEADGAKAIDHGETQSADRPFTNEELDSALAGGEHRGFKPNDTELQPDYTQLETHLRNNFDQQTSGPALPAWAVEDFQWDKSVDRLTGEVKYYVRVKPNVVKQTVDLYPGILAKAYEKVGADEEALAYVSTLTNEIEAVQQTCSTLDQYLGTSVFMWLRERAAQSLIRAYRFQRGAMNHLNRIRPGQPVPDSIGQRQEWATTALRVGGILQRVADAVDPNGQTNVQNAAWTVLRIEANSAQRQVENPNSTAMSNELSRAAQQAVLDAF